MDPEEYNELEDLTTLLEAHVDPNFLGPDGNTALHYACANGNLECAQLLKRYGAVFTYNTFGNSPLHRAVLLKQVPIVQFLFENYPEANVMQKNIYGKSPLDIAFGTNNEELINLVLSHPSAAGIEDEMKKCEKDILLDDKSPQEAN
ncbi:hypothetical protein WA158_002837 [Blastocystis sp. Blastoise]